MVGLLIIMESAFDIRLQYALHTTSFREQLLSDRHSAVLMKISGQIQRQLFIVKYITKG